MTTAFRARLWTLLVCQCVLITGLSLSVPFFALYLHRVRGLPMGWVGAALFAMLAAAGVGQALGGELSDILGSKRVMEGSVAAGGLMMALMSWAMVAAAPVAALVALHILAGFCRSFYDSSVRSWIARACSPRERLVAYGQLRVAINLGWAVGPALGGMLAARSYPGLFAASAAACFVCFLLVKGIVPPVSGARAESRFSLRETLSVASDRRFLRFCAYGLVIAMVMAQLVVSLSIHSVRYVGLTEPQVGLLFTLNGVIVVLFQTPVSRWARSLRLSAGLAAGCLLYGAGYCCVGFAGAGLSMALAVAAVTLGEVLVSPGLHTLAANLAPDRLKGRYIGFQGLSLQLGAACGPLLGGLGLQYLSPRWSPGPWLVVAALGGAAALGFRRLGRELRPQEDGLHDEGLGAVAPAEVLI